MTLPQVLQLLARYRFLAVDEAELQDQLARVLADAGVPFAREVQMGTHGRIDFVLSPDTGLEVKVDGSPSAVLRQLWGYAKAPAIRTLVLVTRRAPLSRLRGPIAGKPLHVVHVTGGLL